MTFWLNDYLPDGIFNPIWAPTLMGEALGYLLGLGQYKKTSFVSIHFIPPRVCDHQIQKLQGSCPSNRTATDWTNDTAHLAV